MMSGKTRPVPQERKAFGIRPEGVATNLIPERANRLVAIFLAALALGGCQALGGPQPTPFPTSSIPLTPTELRYRLIDSLGEVFFCDADFYPVARQDETQLAIERFPEIQADAQEFAAILDYLGLTAGGAFSVEEQLQIYREHKRLAAIILTPAGADYEFSLRTIQGEEITAWEGEITRVAAIKITSSTPTQDMCPICLAETSVIDTPTGRIRVIDLRQGDWVWTRTSDGRRIAAPILFVAANPSPAGHTMLRLTLADGRIVVASPGHPTADGLPISALRLGDPVDGSGVILIENVPYSGSATYDLLPAGETGLYWADGVLLGSTLEP
jgi:hypothetical protein